VKKSERTLVGVAGIAGSLVLVFLLTLPQWDSFSSKNTQVTALKDEVKSLETQKTTLDAQITLLERNTDIPPGITIRKYNEETRAQIIKELLDKMVTLSTSAGNRFISLLPADVDAIITPAPAAAGTTHAVGTTGATSSTVTAPNTGTTVTTATTTTATGVTTTDPNAGLPKPLLSTFGYDLSIRGSYDTLQRFLKTMDVEKELMEITSITLENEISAIPGATSTTGVMPDPQYPIRMTARIRLAMQPE
jgi:hypothetical protein